MRIGQLAQRTGLSADALRLYERMGLIHSRREANGYRDYADDTVHLLGLVRTGQRLGLSLARMAGLMAEMGELPQAARDTALREMMAAQLQRVEARSEELAGLREELRLRLDETCPLTRAQAAETGVCTPPARGGTPPAPGSVERTTAADSGRADRRARIVAG